ncbi:MAG: universal stress protein [Planctomycetaceae bacterium]|nr:universal stress protein [Planctomycetaceae bacterium]
MNAKRIVFPTDFSTCSDAALEHAAAMARNCDGTLLIVHVEEPPIAYGGGEMYYGLPEPDHEAVEKMLARVVPKTPVKYEHHLLMGSPADEVVRFAEDQQADLIVMGTHGRTGMRRVLMGSVAETVVRKALCPVITMKQPEPQAAAAK